MQASQRKSTFPERRECTWISTFSQRGRRRPATCPNPGPIVSEKIARYGGNLVGPNKEVNWFISTAEKKMWLDAPGFSYKFFKTSYRLQGAFSNQI